MNPSSWGDERSRTVTWWDPTRPVVGVEGRTGLDLLRMAMDGEVPPPPMTTLVQARLVEVAEGLAVVECHPDTSTYNSLGTVHGGLMCILADSVAGGAVQSTLPAGVGYTSIDISLQYLRPATGSSGTLVATGRIVKPGRRVAVAGVEIVDGDGKLLATATGTCLVMGGEDPAS